MAEENPEEQGADPQETPSPGTPPSYEISENEAAILEFQQILGDSIAGDKNVDRFSDVPLKIAIELGRVNRPIREILDRFHVTHLLAGILYSRPLGYIR